MEFIIITIIIWLTRELLQGNVKGCQGPKRTPYCLEKPQKEYHWHPDLHTWNFPKTLLKYEANYLLINLEPVFILVLIKPKLKLKCVRPSNNPYTEKAVYIQPTTQNSGRKNKFSFSLQLSRPIVSVKTTMDYLLGVLRDVKNM